MAPLSHVYQGKTSQLTDRTEAVQEEGSGEAWVDSQGVEAVRSPYDRQTSHTSGGHTTLLVNSAARRTKSADRRAAWRAVGEA